MSGLSGVRRGSSTPPKDKVDERGLARSMIGGSEPRRYLGSLTWKGLPAFQVGRLLYRVLCVIALCDCLTSDLQSCELYVK
jgi:hypothetical protein